MAPLEIIPTNDGSDSVFSERYSASYHSKFGAIEESITVFISAGLYHNYLQGKRRLRIFEMGFGTGLNAFLTAIEAQRLGMDIEYVTVELHPLKKELTDKLNFHSVLGHKPLLEKMHGVEWNSFQHISEHFKILKHPIAIQEFSHKGPYDLIYYDAFAPSTQAPLWEEDIHKPLYKQLVSHGQLVTYCAQGRFKRMLKAIGYTLESLPGPAHKKEIIRATKSV